MSDENKDPQAETATTPPVTEPQVTIPETPATQEEPFDKDRAMATIEKLRGIEKQSKKDAKELQELKAEKQKQADAELSEAQREKKRADELAAENATIKADLWRNEAATAAGIPQMADRLKGATKEELLADALELAKTLPQLKVAPKVPVTNPANGTTVNSEQELRAKLWGSTSSLDRGAIERLGGGVIINGK